MPELSRRPYLLRAMLEWIIDSGWTPHLIVDARSETVKVPRQFVQEGRIVLNISASATRDFRIGTDAVEFNARFGGVGHHIHVPVDAVLGIYGRESGEGMVFTDEQPAEGTPPPLEVGETGNDGAPPEPPTSPVPPKPRPSLKIVK